MAKSWCTWVTETVRIGGAVLATLALLGCGRPPSTGTAEPQAAEAALPSPQGGRGSVTGMPDPSRTDRPTPDTSALPPARPLPGDDGIGSIPETGAAVEPGLPAPAEPAPDEPAPQDAAAVVRDYYSAIAGGRFDQAYGLWADEGRASEQSPQQFAAGFADTASVSVEVLAPGRVEGAAGSRYVEVPVAVTAVHRDGSRHRYVGAYILRRAVVDGASEEQRAWRLAAADIREVRL